MDGLISLPINQPASEDYPVIQYADDTLIILHACQQELQTIKGILDSYARATGLKINYTKSQLMPINVNAQKTLDLANALGCQVGEMSFTYLGLPLGTTRPTVRELMPLVDRIERRLTGIAIQLSYGERVQLINSALSSLLSFAMCVLKLPLKLIDIFDRARRHCLWRKEVDRDAKTHSLAAWEMVCRPKKKGGLGILNLQIQNKALLLKYLHKFIHKQDVPWVILVWNAHYDDTPPHAKPPCGSFWWRDVMKLFDKFCKLAVPHARSGDSVVFWLDRWQFNKEVVIMQQRFPRLHSFVIDDTLTIKEVMELSNLTDNFHLPLSVEAFEEFNQLQV